MAETKRTTELYLWSMSVIYLFAFASLFVQIPGLYGDNGILPVKLVLQKVPDSLADLLSSQQPSLLRLLPSLGISDVQVGMDLLCLIGVVLSFLALISKTLRNAFIFFVLWILYLSMMLVGQTFLWFQWDTLLLEVGFLTIIVAPFSLSKVRSTWFHHHDRIAFWLVRWLAFRLMFCSGVVKLLSNCPTWWDLTATTYHYESQCIPMPFSWYFHQLPLWFQKLSVVVTLVTEIPVSFLFFSPIRNHRLFAFICQTVFMILIVVTGNYNFFNYITIVICLSLVDDDFLPAMISQSKLSRNAEKPKCFPLISRLIYPMKWLTNILVYGSLVFGVVYYFRIRFDLLHFTIECATAFDIDNLRTFLRYFVPISIWVGVVCLSLEIISGLLRSIFIETGIMKKLTNASGCLFFGLLAVLLFCVSLVPYTDVEHDVQNRLPSSFNRWFRSTNTFQLTHSYGLFRRMTGVGGRPEVVVEGSEYPDQGWQEYNFLFKPGDVERKPPVVAPHQPRLDWQMWFAALGSYNHNPWFLNLIFRLLTHQEEVLQLIDKGPFDVKPPNYIRAGLYHYHFTSFNRSNTKDWWRREFVREYLPVVWKTEPNFVKYIEGAGIYKSSDGGSKENRRLRYFTDWLHSVFPPSDGYGLCVGLFIAGLLFILMKDSVGGRS